MPTTATVTTTFKWNRKAYINVLDTVKKNTRKALIFYTKKLKAALNVHGHGIPSNPGEYPRRQSGKLRESYRTRSVSRSEHEIVFRVISVNVPYGIWLEEGTVKMKPRPHILRTAEINREKIIEIIKGD